MLEEFVFLCIRTQYPVQSWTVTCHGRGRRKRHNVYYRFNSLLGSYPNSWRNKTFLTGLCQVQICWLIWSGSQSTLATYWTPSWCYVRMSPSSSKNWTCPTSLRRLSCKRICDQDYFPDSLSDFPLPWNVFCLPSLVWPFCWFWKCCLGGEGSCNLCPGLGEVALLEFTFMRTFET